MSSRHPYNAVFPVILVSSIVFSILSLPFFLYRSQPEANSSSFHLDFLPVLESKNRDLTIRYIGAAMVLSVITGISTIELLRRQQPHQTLTTVKPSAPEQAGLESLLDPNSRIDREFEVEQIEPVKFVSPAILETEGSLFIQDDAPNVSLADFASSQPEALIAELNRDYSTCRIWVQHLHRRLFAIQIEGQFYSFFRLLPTQESARQTALQLSENLNRTVITPIEQDFAVWVWQPEAELEAQST